MKITSFLTAVALTAFASNTTAQDVEHLSISYVTPSMMSFHPEALRIEGTGLDQVLHVYVGGAEALILTKSANELTFLPREDDPGLWPLLVVTPRERAEATVGFMPYIEVLEQDGFWNENHTRFQLVDNAFGIHIQAGAPAFYVLFVSFGERTPAQSFPGIAFELLLSDPYRAFDSGFVPTSVDRFVRQHKLPIDMMGHELFVQGMVDYPTFERKSFTNMVPVDPF